MKHEMFYFDLLHFKSLMWTCLKRLRKDAKRANSSNLLVFLISGLMGQQVFPSLNRSCYVMLCQETERHHLQEAEAKANMEALKDRRCPRMV